MPSTDNYNYHIDIVTPEVIAGWVKPNSDNASIPIVEIYSEDQLVWQAKANLKRPDLLDAGLGDVAFSIVPTETVLKKDLEAVDVFIDGVKMNKEPYTFLMLAPRVEDYYVRIDHVSKEQVSGWACYKENFDYKPVIELRSEGVVLGRSTAKHFRKDLLDAKKGDGKLAYSIDIELSKVVSPDAICTLYVDGKKVPEASVLLSVSQQEIDYARLLGSFGEQIKDFNALLGRETLRIKQQIIDFTPEGQSSSLNVVSNVTIQNIAELAARMTVLEKSLANILSKK